MKLNWNDRGVWEGGEGGGRVQTKKPSVVRVWIFSGTTQWHLCRDYNQRRLFSSGSTYSHGIDSVCTYRISQGFQHWR